MVQLPCSQCQRFISYGAIKDCTSFAYCRHCVIKNSYIALFTTCTYKENSFHPADAQLFAYYGFHCFQPMGGHSYGGGPHRTCLCGDLMRLQMSCWVLINSFSFLYKIQGSWITPISLPWCEHASIAFYSGFPPLQCLDSIPGPLDPELSPLPMLPRRLQGLSRQSLGWFQLSLFPIVFLPVFL